MQCRKVPKLRHLLGNTATMYQVKTYTASIYQVKPPTWEHSLNIPGKETIENRIKHHHNHTVKHIPLVIHHRCNCQVRPLHTNALLLIPCYVATPEAKSYRR